MGKKENEFQADLIEEIQKRIPDALIEKGDATYRNGTPDLTIFRNEQWAKLECKQDDDSDYQPGQEQWIDIFNTMSFCREIDKTNKEEVLDELYRFLGVQ